MSFIRFSDDFAYSGTTAIENIFFKEYMAECTEHSLKVYLFGLYQNTNNLMNCSMNDMMSCLHISEEDVLTAFKQLEELGLCTIISTNPIQIAYLPVKSFSARTKRIKPEKYADFSKQVQKILTERMIGTNEFNEYYYCIEACGFQPEALIIIIKYCTSQKGDNVSYKYILKVAHDWANRGLTTLDKVTKEATSRSQQNKNVAKIIAALHLKRQLENDDHEYYIKWTKEFGFDINNIMCAISLMKDKKGGMTKLNTVLTEYFTNKAFSEIEMRNYVDTKQHIKDITININKALGVYYEVLDPVIKNYIQPWLSLGFDNNGLILLANYCFKKNNRSLESMDSLIKSLYKQGVISEEDVKIHFAQAIEKDSVIKEILEGAGLTCSVNKWHRENYTTWTEVWNFSHELIIYASKISQGMNNPIAYINKVLSSWKNNNINTLEKAKSYSNNSDKDIYKKTQYNSHNRYYTEDELNALIDNIDDIEI